LNKTFEHLLGLSAKDALAILRGAGIFGVRVTFTSAPAPLKARQRAPEEAPARTDMLRAVAGQFAVSESEEEAANDPLLEPELTDGMLTEARVVGVRDDGRQLIVSRFRVSPAGETQNHDTN